MRRAAHIGQIITAINTSDGGGVKLKRSLGSRQLESLDPFLMLDEFKSDKGVDYIAGFPSHPHRGFETVTYMIHGKMKHQDSHGNEGIIESGGVQWMTAGKGIIHSEMPMQEDGLMWGFQLWVNLPAQKKMCEPRYQDIPAKNVPVVNYPNGNQVRVVSGLLEDPITHENVEGCVRDIVTGPVFLDISIKGGNCFEYDLPEGVQGFIYTFEGEVEVENHVLKVHQLGTIEHGSHLDISTKEDSRCLVIAALPIGEPIAKYGPFVMNTEEELQQAFADFRSGAFA